MIVRNKTKRRLLILLAVSLVLAGGAVVAYGLRKAQIRRENAALRAEGVDAFQKGDYEAALDALGKYTRSRGDDAEALYMVAQACRKVPNAGPKTLQAAIHFLRRYLILRPNDAEARSMLLELYVQFGFNSEALETAKAVLARTPDDLAALRATAASLAALRKPQEALPHAQRLAQIEPLNLEYHVLVLALLDQAGRNADIIPYAEALLEKSFDDGRFELLMGMAYGKADDWTESQQRRAEGLVARKALQRPPKQKSTTEDEQDKRWARHEVSQALIQRAADSIKADLVQKKLSDVYYLQLAVSELDRVGLSDRSLALLQSTEIGRDDPWLRRLLVRRLWETGRFEDVDKAVQALKLDDPATDPEQHALRALALIQLKRKSEAQPIVAALKARPNNPLAAGWAAIVESMFLAEPPNPRACIEPVYQALQGRRREPYLHFFLAEASVALGEQEIAKELFAQAYQENPAWARPLMRLSCLLVETGQREEALAVADAAWQRSPNSVAFAINYASIFAANVKSTETDKLNRLVEMVAQIQKIAPGEEQTLPIHVLALAKNGQRADALRAAETALSAEKPPSTATLLVLANVSREAGLGLEDRCFDLAAKSHGISPDLAYARAMDLLQKGRSIDGLKLIDDCAAKAPASESVSWRFLRARFLEEMRDPRAAEAWVALGDSADVQQNLVIQREILKARSVQADAAFLSRTIDRIRAVTGDRSVGWRLARAKLLLAGSRDAAAGRDAAAIMKDAVELVPTDPNARRLYASALERAGSSREAIEQMSLASRLNPASNAIALDLAKLYQSRGDFARAREQIDRLNLDQLDPIQRRQVVAMLAQAGDSARAMDILKTATTGDSRGDALAMIALHRQRHQLKEAEELINQLLAKPDLLIIQVAIDFYASESRKDDAERMLRKLDDLPDLKPGDKDFITAQYQARYGAADKALEYFIAAYKARPEMPAFAEALVLQHLRMGQITDALSTAEAALKANPGSPRLAALMKHEGDVRSVSKEQAMIPLVTAIMESPEDADVAAEAIRILADAVRNRRPTAPVMAQLRPLADKAQKLMPLQRLLVAKYVQMGKTDDAIAIATRCLKAVPTSPELAQLTAEVFSAAGNWRQALVVAAQWRELTLADPLPADLFIAQMHLRLNEAALAMKQVQPYIAAARQGNDARDVLVVLTQAKALLMNREPAKAGELIWPRASKQPQWRAVWLQLSADIQDPAALSTWLERIAPVIPADAQPEQVALANAWYQAGNRLSKPEFGKRARELLDRLAARPDAAVEVIFARGVMYEVDGDAAQAEAYYRRVLASNASHIVARNNLAMILARRGDKLDEALDLAAGAVKAAPRAASLHDTLAFVQIQRKDYPSATASIRRAIALEPDNIEFRVNLLAALVGSGDRDEGMKVLRELESLIDNSNVPADVLGRYNAARAQLRPPAATQPAAAGA